MGYCLAAEGLGKKVIQAKAALSISLPADICNPELNYPSFLSMVQEGVSLLFLGLDISPSQHYHLSVSSGFPGNLLIPVYTPAYKSKMSCPRTRHIDLARC